MVFPWTSVSFRVIFPMFGRHFSMVNRNFPRPMCMGRPCRAQCLALCLRILHRSGPDPAHRAWRITWRPSGRRCSRCQCSLRCSRRCLVTYFCGCSCSDFFYFAFLNFDLTLKCDTIIIWTYNMIYVIGYYMGLSENSVPLNPITDHYPY